MMMKTILNRSLMALVTGGLLMAFLPVHAEYVVTPTRLFLKPNKGKAVGTASLQIMNDSPEKVRFKAYVSDWTMDETGNVKPSETPLANGLSDKTYITPREFEIAPKASQTIR